MKGLFFTHFGSHGFIYIRRLTFCPLVNLLVILQVVLIQTLETVKQDMTLLLIFLIPKFALVVPFYKQAFPYLVEFLLTSPLKLSVRQPLVEELLVLLDSVMPEELQEVLPDNELRLL